ncbi:MAG: hypothetical protein ACMG6H_11160 [Acidobacteriota bacterium]
MFEALKNPNIATIHEIGEPDRTHYIAMEFSDGDSLREKIHRDWAPLGELLKYLVQVTEGLAKAHTTDGLHFGAPGGLARWKADSLRLCK